MFYILLYYLVTITYSIVHYVNPNNLNTYGDGTSWDEAFTSLQLAIFTINSLKQINSEIWLAGNYTYSPVTTDRSMCFQITTSLSVYGGFKSTELSTAERPSGSEYETIISGDIGTPNDNSDNCYHVLTYKDYLLLDKITIANGNANYKHNYGTQDDHVTDKYGAAIIHFHSNLRKTLYLNDVIIRDNTAINGGALWTNNANINIIIKDSKFENNIAIMGEYEGGYGGAIYMYHLSNTTIINTMFTKNYATARGGAIYQDYGAYLYCSDCIFNDNQASMGGAIFAEDRNSQTQGTFPIIKSSTFVNNIAGNCGGAILFYNGIIATLENNIFLSNYANIGNGGAVALIDSQLHDDSNGNVYSGNTATQSEYDDVYNEISNYQINVDITYNISNELMKIYNVYTSASVDTDLFPFDISDVICFVDGDNTNLIQNGMTWNTAYNELQECINALELIGGEIWVKSGVYKPSTVPNFKILVGKTDDMHKSFLLYDNVRIYGGFEGSETMRNERNFYENPTYLSCNLDINVYCNQILIAADNTLVDGFIFIESGFDNNRRRLANNLNVELILTASSYNSGGGIYSNSTNISVANSIFMKLFTGGKGGAVYCIGQSGDDTEHLQSPMFINVAFLGNKANARGGAIAADVGCNFVCEYCTFQDNICNKKGGAVYLDFSSNPIIRKTEFKNNIAMESGGCIAADGVSYTKFTDEIIFIDNKARWEGACLYSGSGVDMNFLQGFEFDTEPIFFNNHIIDHQPGQNNIYGWPYTIIKRPSSEPLVNTTAKPTGPPTPITPSPTTILPDNYDVNQPNFIIFYIDDALFTNYMNMEAPIGVNLHGKDISYLDIELPNIQSIMDEGIAFQRAYSAGPKCAPSRYSLLTGKYPIKNHWAKERTLKTSSGEFGTNVTIQTQKLHLNDSIYNIPNTLKNNGYFTGMVGKYHLMTTDANGHGIDCSRLSSTPDTVLYELCTDIVKENGFDFVDAYYHSNIATNKYFSHNPEWLVHRSQEFIRQSVVQNQPFFLYFSHTLTHSPSYASALTEFDISDTPKGKLSGDEIPYNTGMASRDEILQRASYVGTNNYDRNAIYLWMDESLGAMIKYLEDNKLYDNTFIILNNDHGMGAKGTLYEQGCRVMQFVRYPPLFGTDGHVLNEDFVVSNIDIAATIYEVAGITDNIPKEYDIDGISWLSDALVDIYIKVMNQDASCCGLRFVDMYNSHALVSKDYKYIFRATKQFETDGNIASLYPHATDSEQFYLLNTDPSEQINQIDNEMYKDIIFEFKYRMFEYVNNKACVVPECKSPDITYIPSWSNWTLPVYDPYQMTCRSVISWDYSWRKIVSAWNESEFLTYAEAIFLSKPSYDECGELGHMEYYFYFEQNGRRVDLHEIICCGNEKTFGMYYEKPSGYLPNKLMAGFGGYKSHPFIPDIEPSKWHDAENIIILLCVMIPCCCVIIFIIYKIKKYKRKLLAKSDQNTRNIAEAIVANARKHQAKNLNTIYTPTGMQTPITPHVANTNYRDTDRQKTPSMSMSKTVVSKTNTGHYMMKRVSDITPHSSMKRSKNDRTPYRHSNKYVRQASTATTSFKPQRSSVIMPVYKREYSNSENKPAPPPFYKVSRSASLSRGRAQKKQQLYQKSTTPGYGAARSDPRVTRRNAKLKDKDDLCMQRSRSVGDRRSRSKRRRNHTKTTQIKVTEPPLFSKSNSANDKRKHDKRRKDFLPSGPVLGGLGTILSHCEHDNHDSHHHKDTSEHAGFQFQFDDKDDGDDIPVTPQTPESINSVKSTIKYDENNESNSHIEIVYEIEIEDH